MQREDARELLRRMLGDGADFREGQWEAIDLAANGRKRVLVVQRTGWGKSVVYFLAAKILREAGSGPTLLISRLLPPGVPVLGTTATANDRVVKDIESQIAELTILRGPLVRRSLKLFNIRLHDQAERMAWLAHFLPKLGGSGIVYTLTVQDARR